MKDGAQGSVACSVTEGHRAHNVCGVERTFEAVTNTNDKRKTLLNSRVLACGGKDLN